MHDLTASSDERTASCPAADRQSPMATPVAWVAEQGWFVVVKHELAASVLRNPTDFRQWDGDEIYGPGQAPPMGNPRHWSPELAAVMADGWPPVSTLVTGNPPFHGRYRKLASSLFSAHRTANAMQTRMQEIIDGLIDALPPRGPVDFVSAFAAPFPTAVTEELLQVPSSMRSQFIRWADASILTTNGRPVPPAEMIECGRAIVEAQKYFMERLIERRGQSGEDIISFIANAELKTDDDASRPLRPAEQLGLVFHFVVGGIETTANFLGLLLNEVLTRPELAATVVDDPGKCSAIVEEALRLQGPVQALFRRATRDVELGGVLIPAGAKVLVQFGAANRDPEVFSESDRFDVPRGDVSRHLSFGHGPHYCLGAPLARKESEMALVTLLQRIPTLRLVADTPPRLRAMAFFRGYEQMDVDYDEVLR